MSEYELHEASRRGTSLFPLPVDAIPPLRGSVDFVVIVFLSIANGMAYHLVTLGQVGSVDLFIGSGMAVAALFVSVLQANGMYAYPSPNRRLADLAVIWTLVFLFLTAIAFILKISDEFSRGSVLAFYFTGLVAVLILRRGLDAVLNRALASGSLLGRRLAVVAEPDELADDDGIRTLEQHGCTIERLVVLPEQAQEPRSDEEWARFAEHLVASVRQTRADEVILALNWSHPTLVRQVMATLRRLPIPVRLIPDSATRNLLEGRTTSIGPVIAVELQRAPLTELERALKRCLDVVLAAAGIVSLFPLLVLVAVAVRLDSPGPVLFRQSRMGFNGRPFRICKFRTMNVLDDGPTIQQAQRNDPRVTRVGRWLRKSSIDELPQLINVLKGEMSLVGPRPHALAHDNAFEQMIADYALRYHVKPGITGWAQVNGLRGETPTVNVMKQRVEHDLWYIKNWSLSLDLLILAKTVMSQMDMRSTY